MAEDRDKDTPSLEPPSLFRRKKKAQEPETPAETAPETPPEPAREPAPEPLAPLVEAEPAAPVAPPLAPLSEAAPPLDDSPTTIFDDTTEPTPAEAPAPVVTGEAEVPNEPKPPREPWLGGTPAAAVTGLFVGALIVAATAGSLRICTAVKGTSSCGGQGFFLLVAILIVAVLVGAALLRGAGVPEPGSTSFLAVGLLSVIALLFLVGSIFEWWMVIVIPLASVATFLLSYWVTATFVDPANDGSDPVLRPEEHDVR
jgi:hypothetical protein